MTAAKQDNIFSDPDKLKNLLFSEKGSEIADRLSSSLEPGQAESALIGVVNRSQPGEIKPLIKLLFQHNSLKKLPELMWHVIGNADAKTRAILHRKVFPGLFTEGVEYQALYGALTLSRDIPRRRYLDELKIPLQKKDRTEMTKIRDRVLDLCPPEGFNVVNPCIGCGKTSRISLLKKTTDNRLYVWKQPANDSPRIRREFQQLVERSVVWKRLGISSALIFWDKDRKNLLQPYVNGTTLKQALNSTPLLTDPAHELLPPLIDLFQRMVTNNIYISGLNTENLIFSNSRWEIIDSGSITVMETPLIAWTKQSLQLRKKWARRESFSRTDIKNFLDRIESALGLRKATPLRKNLAKLHLKVTPKRKKVC